MSFSVCRECRLIFTSLTNERLCPKCSYEKENLYRKVKEYIYDNPGVTMRAVSKAMKVSIEQLSAWVREERLEFASVDENSIHCDRCGILITTGRFCGDCKKTLVDGLAMAQSSTSKESEQGDTKRSGGYKSGSMHHISY